MILHLLIVALGLIAPNLPDLRNLDECVRPSFKIPEKTPYRVVPPPMR